MLLGAKQQSVLTRYLMILPEELYEPDAGEWMELKLSLRCSFFLSSPWKKDALEKPYSSLPVSEGG